MALACFQGAAATSNRWRSVGSGTDCKSEPDRARAVKERQLPMKNSPSRGSGKRRSTRE